MFDGLFNKRSVSYNNPDTNIRIKFEIMQFQMVEFVSFNSYKTLKEQSYS